MRLGPVGPFGLGSSAVIGEVRIEWPSGATQILRNVPADQVLTVREDEASEAPSANVDGATPAGVGAGEARR